jgi:hypothetical protein
MKINFRTFLDTADEWHAFVIGWSEVICPWKPHFPMPIDHHNPLVSEYHYYIAGRAFAVITWLLLAKLIQLWFF